MKCKYFDTYHNCTFADGFTLIELLVVISVISLLMAILFPVLNKTRSVTKRIFCLNNLREIATAWFLYVEYNDGTFYQGINTNHDFGGWKGNGGFSHRRPLNRYVGLDPNIPTDDGAKIFRCPADKGGIMGQPPQDKAYQYFGNSYQTNILIIGPTQIGFGTATLRPLHEAIDTKLRGIKLSCVSANPSLLALVGDNNWVHEWDPRIPTHAKDWHDKARYHNLAFLDGHVGFVRIRKGLYVTSEYSVLPFSEFNKLALSIQEEIE